MLDLQTQPHRDIDPFVDIADLYVVGAGGVRSRVEFHSSADASMKRSLYLPPFHSVYALDLNYATGNLSAGTKGGLILIIEAVHGSRNLESRNIFKILQGAPILSICWASSREVVASDAAGRCLLWHYRTSPAIPLQLPTIGGPICALLRLDDATIVGLSASGTLLFWQTHLGQLMRTIDVPKPPSKSALVQMKYWTEKNAIVFPTDEGNICLVTPSTEEVALLALKSGPCYAIDFFKTHLACAEFSKGNLVLFSKDSTEAVATFILPEGVASMYIAESDPINGFFIGRSGRLFRCVIEESGIKSKEYYPGEFFRSVSGPDIEAVRRFNSLKTQQKADKIISELSVCGDRIDEGDRHEYLDSLERLGYKHVALALEADRMESSGNVVDSIQTRRDLLQLLPKDDSRISLSLMKYAKCLETTWQLSEAYSTLSTVHRSTPDLVDAEYLEKLSTLSKIIEESNNWMIDPDLSIDTAIRVSTVIEKRFKGRYIFRKHTPIYCRRHNIGSNQIADKYNQIRSESQQEVLPVAVSEQSWLIARTGAKLVPTVGFATMNIDHSRHLKIVLHVINDNLSTVISPMTIFEWLPKETNTYKQENENARQQLEPVLAQKDNGYIQSAIIQSVELAVRRLITALSSVQ